MIKHSAIYGAPVSFSSSFLPIVCVLGMKHRILKRMQIRHAAMTAVVRGKKKWLECPDSL